MMIGAYSAIFTGPNWEGGASDWNETESGAMQLNELVYF